MRLRALVFVVVATVVATPTLADAAPVDPAALRRQADAWMAAPLATFLSAKAAAPRPFDWSDDGCSVVPDHPLGLAFRDACRRHDFGYRNYGRGLRLDPTPARRRQIDRRFLADLQASCRGARTPMRVVCPALAWTYYEGVRAFGGGAFE
jgi:hypothetical protein